MFRPFLIILFVALFFSCTDSGKNRKKDRLNQSDFFNLLVDIHKAEGIIDATHIKINKYKGDTAGIYNFVLKKHNVSRQTFNNTVEYYSLHGKQYSVLYDSLSLYFKNLENELKLEIEKEKTIKKQEVKARRDSLNLWKLKKEWNLPDDGKKSPIPFKIKTKKHGQYKLQAKIKIFPDDQSVNQRMTIIANYTDGTKDMNSTGTIIKDGKFEFYTVSIITDKKKKLKSISGWVLDHSKKTGEKHAHVKKISLRYIQKI